MFIFSRGLEIGKARLFEDRQITGWTIGVLCERVTEGMEYQQGPTQDQCGYIVG